MEGDNSSSRRVTRISSEHNVLRRLETTLGSLDFTYEEKEEDLSLTSFNNKNIII